MHLSRFFTLAELSRSDTATREGIPNQPAEAQISSLRTLCTAVLDPLREAVARQMRISSGFRGPALNARIGGSATSQHSQGQAADVQVPGLDMLELFKTVIRLKLPFDQLIYEAQSASVKWVHLSHRATGNRGEIRIAQFNAAGRPTGYPLVSAEQALAMQERITRSSSANLDPGYVERADEPEFEPVPEMTAATPVRAPARRRSGARAVAAQAPATAAANRAPARKAAANKAPATQAVAKKAAARKAPAKSSAVKKPAANKAETRAAPSNKARTKAAAGRGAKATSRPRAGAR